MRVLITGGAGFVGQELCKALLRGCQLRAAGRIAHGAAPAASAELVAATEIVLFDVPGAFDTLRQRGPCTDSRVQCVTGSIEDPGTVRQLVTTPDMVVFHLAGIMSGQGEKDFDLCLRVNMDGTRNVLEACRAASKDGRLVKLVFASSGAAFGETAECPVADTTKLVPLNTYGVTKTVGELLVNDYTRKGFVDGCSARLPTVVVRPGKPNAASTSCFSGVIREPLKGVDVALPVERHLPHAVTSARALIANLVALQNVDFGVPGQPPVDRALNLPSTPTTLGMLVQSLHRVVPEDQLGKLGSITDKVDPFLSKVVGSMAMKEMDQSRALAFGLKPVPDIDSIVREYIEDFGGDCVVSLPRTDGVGSLPRTDGAPDAPAAKRTKLAEAGEEAAVA